MSIHSDIGGSKAYMFMNCKGSVKHLKDHPLPSTDYSEEGTFKHDLCKRALEEDDFNGEGYECEQEIRGYKDYVYDLWLSDPTGSNKLAVEEPMAISSISDEAFGTPDAVVFKDFDVLHIVDAKFGFVKVSPKGNAQLMYYALAAIDTLGIDPSSVVLHIYQPSSEEPWSKYECNMEELKAFSDRLRSTIEDIKEGDDTKVVGKWCQFCNKAQCDKFSQQVKEVTKVNVDTKGFPKDISNFDDERLLKIKDMGPSIAGMVKQAESILMERAKARGIKGYKLIEGKGNRKWALDNDSLIDELQAELPQNIEFLSSSVLSISQLEKRIKSSSALSKSQKVKLINKVNEFVVRPNKGLKLVPNSTQGEEVLSMATLNYL